MVMVVFLSRADRPFLFLVWVSISFCELISPIFCLVVVSEMYLFSVLMSVSSCFCWSSSTAGVTVLCVLLYFLAAVRQAGIIFDTIR